jgi:inner membrane protein
MPSPVGHSLMGYIIYRATGGGGESKLTGRALYLFAANAPDLDFLPGLLAGNLSLYHHGPSHSVGFAILFGMIANLFCSRQIYTFLVAFSLYLSHVVLDYLVQDPSAPYGVPVLWPLTGEYYMAPFAFFPRFDYLAGPTGSMLPVIFSFHNLTTIAIEILLLSPLLVLVSVWPRISDREEHH